MGVIPHQNNNENNNNRYTIIDESKNIVLLLDSKTNKTILMPKDAFNLLKKNTEQNKKITINNLKILPDRINNKDKFASVKKDKKKRQKDLFGHEFYKR